MIKLNNITIKSIVKSIIVIFEEFLNPQTNSAKIAINSITTASIVLS